MSSLSADKLTIQPRIHPSWKQALAAEFAQPYFLELKQFLLDEKARGLSIYPPGNRIFFAFDSCPFDKVKVVILGQDPYHGRGQAHGLCFSVKEGIPKPPSLKNIFKELHTDLGVPVPASGNLEKWSRQGVLLLNASLTVRDGQPGSHFGKGWEAFTDAAIRAVAEERQHVVFLLWGRFAAEKDALIDASRHSVLKAPHPSPFSADRGFFGCRHFSRANELLRSHGQEAIDWDLTTAHDSAGALHAH